MKIFYQSLYASVSKKAGVDSFVGMLQGGTKAKKPFHIASKNRVNRNFKGKERSDLFYPDSKSSGKRHFYALNIKTGRNSEKFMTKVLGIESPKKGNEFTHKLVQKLLSYSLRPSPPDIICMGECLFQDIKNKKDFSLEIAGNTYNLEAYERDGTEGNASVPANNAFAVWVKGGIKTNEIIIHKSLVGLEYAREDGHILRVAFVHTPNNDPQAREEVGHAKIDHEYFKEYYEKVVPELKIWEYDIVMGDTNQEGWGELAFALTEILKAKDPKNSSTFIGRRIPGSSSENEVLKKAESLGGIRNLDDQGLSTGGGDATTYDTVIVKSTGHEVQKNAKQEPSRIVYEMQNKSKVKMLGYTRRFFEAKDMENDKKSKCYVVTDHMGVMVDEYSKSSNEVVHSPLSASPEALEKEELQKEDSIILVSGDEDTEEATPSTPTFSTEKKENRKRFEPGGGKDNSSQPTSKRQKLSGKDVNK